MELEESSEWEKIETPKEAIDILVGTTFEFADIILLLCVEEEKIHSSKYVNIPVKPSTKIRVITALLKLFPKERLMQHYVNYVLNWKPYVDKRDAKFFLENDHIYPRAPKQDIEFFRDLWRPNSTFHLNEIEKETVFEYFDGMLHACEEWKEMTGYTAKWEKNTNNKTLNGAKN